MGFYLGESHHSWYGEKKENKKREREGTLMISTKYRLCQRVAFRQVINARIAHDQDLNVIQLSHIQNSFAIISAGYLASEMTNIILGW